MSSPRRLFVPMRDRGGEGEMAVLDFGDPGRPVDLIFAHANGFNAAAYRRLLEPLSERLRIWAPDLRGHGRSRLSADPRGRRDWSDHAGDIAGLLDAAQGGPVVLAGHSMGAVSALMAAERRPDRVSRLVLFDPVIWPPLVALALGLPFTERLGLRTSLARAALRRRDRFDSREAAFASYRDRGAFRGWAEDSLRDYLSDGLIETPEGDLALSCSPAWEASNYAAQDNAPWGRMRRFLGRGGGSAVIVRAGEGSTCHMEAPPSGLDAQARARLRIETASGGDHLFPLNRPEIARAALFDIVR